MGEKLDLDDNFKRLINQLGEAINDSLSESEAISDVMAKIRSSGYDLLLILEVTIGLNKRAEAEAAPRTRRKPRRRTQFHLTNQDTEFLRSLKISVDEDAP